MQLRTVHIASIVLGLSVVIGAGIGLLTPTNEAEVGADSPVGNARYTVANQSVKVGQEFTMDLKLDTTGDEVVGTDIVLFYDPELLEVMDADTAEAGTQVVPGKLFDLVPANSVDTAAGKIVFSATQNPTSGTVEAVNSVIATVKFKAKATGTATVQYDFTAGATDDTNAIEAEGGDLLASVQNAAVTIE